MPRIAVKVSQRQLTEAIQKAESEQTFPNHSELWKAVAQVYNQMDKGEYPDISPSVVYQRVKAWKIAFKTEMGKRGRESSSETPKDTKPKKLSNKAKKIQAQSAEVAILKSYIPKRFHPKLKKALNGSGRAAMVLKCLDCSDWQTQEVARCTVKVCPLWLQRPYQKISVNGQEIEENEEDGLDEQE